MKMSKQNFFTIQENNSFCYTGKRFQCRICLEFVCDFNFENHHAGKHPNIAAHENIFLELDWHLNGRTCPLQFSSINELVEHFQHMADERVSWSTKDNARENETFDNPLDSRITRSDNGMYCSACNVERPLRQWTDDCSNYHFKDGAEDVEDVADFSVIPMVRLQRYDSVTNTLNS